jgi:dihydroxyacetone kinase
MLKGANAALRRAEDAPPEAGAAWLLARLGRAWAERAGGTSGVLWGAALEAFGVSLGEERESYGPEQVADAIDAFAESIQDLGRAAAGDKTLLDALLPFAASFREQASAGATTAEAWAAAADAATQGARGTAAMRPRVGRARPLAEKSVGTPDAGATSFALVVTRVGDLLTGR